MDKLLPCPFCGGEQAIKTRYIGYGSLGLGSHDEYRVVCQECRASSDEYRHEAEAVSAWNRRAQPDNKPPTNADRIKAMSDEELAREMLFFCPSGAVLPEGTACYTGLGGKYFSTADETIKNNLAYLQQPHKEEP